MHNQNAHTKSHVAAAKENVKMDDHRNRGKGKHPSPFDSHGMSHKELDFLSEADKLKHTYLTFHVTQLFTSTVKDGW